MVAEHVFYNNSSFNGNSIAASTQDDNAIAPDTLPAGYLAGAPGDTALLGAVPMGSISNVTVVNDGNYDAFPGITSLPNGELIVVYRSGTNHVSVGATINYTVSKDGGETWSAPQVLAAPPAGLECRDAEIATLANGSVMVSFFQYNDATENAYPFVVSGTYNSATGSMTWGSPVQIVTAFPGGGAACTSKVIQLADGTLLLPIYGDSAAIIRSTDGGRTWGGQVTTALSTATNTYDESNGIVDPNGDIVVFVRCDSSLTADEGIWRTVSTDGGQTWSTPQEVIGDNCRDAITGATGVGYPGRPSPVLLPSGAIVMLDRMGTSAGVSCNYWTSWDGGLTWTCTPLIAGTNGQEYGSLTLLPGGQLAGITAYQPILWAPNTYYPAGATVGLAPNGTWIDYQCLVAHTSDATYDATEAQYWRQLSTGACGIFFQNFVDSYSLDKAPLLPGETASFLNYTSYSKGINGIMVDFDSLPGTPTAADFAFSVGDNSTPSSWAAAPAPVQIAVRAVNGIERVTIIWADNAIENEWLQVTVKATADTGLAQPVTFYYGNLIGSTGDSAAAAAVTASDVAAIENNPTAAAALSNPFDLNRDGQVNAADTAIAQSSAASAVSLASISPPYILPLPLAGDANGDGKVDIGDLTVVLTNYDKSGMKLEPGRF